MKAAFAYFDMTLVLHMELELAPVLQLVQEQELVYLHKLLLDVVYLQFVVPFMLKFGLIKGKKSIFNREIKIVLRQE